MPTVVIYVYAIFTVVRNYPNLLSDREIISMPSLILIKYLWSFPHNFIYLLLVKKSWISVIVQILRDRLNRPSITVFVRLNEAFIRTLNYLVSCEESSSHSFSCLFRSSFFVPRKMRLLSPVIFLRGDSSQSIRSGFCCTIHCSSFHVRVTYTHLS